MIASGKEEREKEVEQGRMSPPYPSVYEREEFVWDEHIRLYILLIYFQHSGFMVIGKALPSRSFPDESIFLPLLHFFLLCSGNVGRKAFERNNTKRKKSEVMDCNANTNCIKTSLGRVSLLFFLILSHFHRCSALRTDASLSLPCSQLLWSSRDQLWPIYNSWCLLMTFNDDLLWIIKPGSPTANINFNYSVGSPW